MIELLQTIRRAKGVRPPALAPETVLDGWISAEMVIRLTKCHQQRSLCWWHDPQFRALSNLACVRLARPFRKDAVRSLEVKA